MIVVVSYGKYPRSIARVFIDLYSVQQLTRDQALFIYLFIYLFIFLLLWLEGDKNNA